MIEKWDVWICQICGNLVKAPNPRIYQPNIICGPHNINNISSMIIMEHLVSERKIINDKSKG